jgi:hypothetical protein
MAVGERVVSDVLRIMRLALGRRNENDPDSNDQTLIRYLNDFISLTMSDDVKLFEQFGTLEFIIDETNTTGVYTFNDVGASFDFVNISAEAYISLLDPVNNSVSWNYLPIYQDPGEFFAIWGINNDEILIPGYPTALLYYGNEFTFRTIPETSYLVKIYGYKKNNNFNTVDDDDEDAGDQAIPYDYWLRYLAYGAALNYARDFRYEAETKNELKADFAHERKLMLTHTHNQIKQARAMPRF